MELMITDIPGKY